MITTDIAETKKRIQFNAMQVWAKHGFRGTLQIATGIGKTRIGVLCGCEFIRRSMKLGQVPEKTLIVVPQTNLRDNEWVDEIYKWGYQDCLDYVTIECIQTAYKRKGDYFNTLIVDEVHSALSDEYVKLFFNNKFNRILGLSATLVKEKSDILNNIGAPIIFNYDLNNAEKDGIVSDYMAYVLMVELNEDERFLYQNRTKELAQYGIELINTTGITSPIQAAGAALRDKATSGYLKGVAGKYQRALSERKQIIYQAEAKYRVLYQLIDRLYKDNTIIVFNESIEFIENFVKLCNTHNPAITCVVYHSKLKKKQKEKILEQFKTGEAKVLLSAKALNAGFNVPNANVGIVVSGTSSPLDDTQRRGRILRPQEGKMAVHINFCVADTVEQSWVSKRSNGKKLVKLNANQMETIIDTL